MEKKVRAVCYCRVSTEEQAEHGYSIDAQIQAIKQYCSVYGKDIVDQYVDAGISGKEMTKRLALQRMLEDAKESKFDEVIVWKLNRLSRNTKDLLEIVGILNKNNVSFTSISEKFDTSQPTGKFVMQMLASVGELERNTIVDNVKLALKQRARLGLHSGGVALGYTLIPSKTRPHKNDLVIVPEEAALVRRIYDMFLSGYGFHHIVNTLNAEGFTTRRGKKFSYVGIKTIIDNPLYKGWVQYGIFEDWAEKRRKGRTNNPIVVKGIHEAIIDEETWEKAQAIRRATTRSTPNIYGNLLVGILKCPHCGGPMIMSYSHYKSRKDGQRHLFRNYHCFNHKKHTGLCDEGCFVKADEAEQYVLNQIKKIVSHPKMLNNVIEKVRSPNGRRRPVKKEELFAMEKKLIEIDNRRGKIVDLYSFGQIDKTLLDSRLQDLDAQKKVILENKVKIEQKSDDSSSSDLSVEKIKKVLQKFDDLLSVASPDQKRILLRLLIDHITVKDKKVEKIYLKIGDEMEKVVNNGAPLVSGQGIIFYV